MKSLALFAPLSLQGLVKVVLRVVLDLATKSSRERLSFV